MSEAMLLLPSDAFVTWTGKAFLMECYSVCLATFR